MWVAQVQCHDSITKDVKQVKSYPPKDAILVEILPCLAALNQNPVLYVEYEIAHSLQKFMKNS